MLPPTSWNHRPVGKRMSGGGSSAGAGQVQVVLGRRFHWRLFRKEVMERG